MTFTATRSAHPFHGSYGCNGLNHRDIGVAGYCDDCGAPVFKAEKGQLTDIGRNNSGAEVFQCWRAHHCDPKFVATRGLRDAEALVAGNFPKEVEVEVFKGRKVPVGTTGIVRWIGEGSYLGDVRLGLAVEGQTKLVYVAAANCRVSSETLAAAQAIVDGDKAEREARTTRLDALMEEYRQIAVTEFRLDDEYAGAPGEEWKQYRAEKITPLRERQIEILTEVETLKAQS